MSDSAELNMRLHASCDCATKSEPSLTYGACPLSQALVYVSATRRKLCCRKSPTGDICARLGLSSLGFFNFPSFWSCSCLVSYFWVPVSAFALCGSAEFPVFRSFLLFLYELLRTQSSFILCDGEHYRISTHLRCYSPAFATVISSSRATPS